MAIALAAGSVAARAQSSTPVKYSNAELKQKMQEAQTDSQYQALASYFRSRQENFEQKAQAEKAEWERRSQNVTGAAAKYPRPVDSAKNLYEYYAYEAQQMSQEAAHYENQATHNESLAANAK
jgi:cell shape-determining protein MreC